MILALVVEKLVNEFDELLVDYHESEARSKYQAPAHAKPNFRGVMMMHGQRRGSGPTDLTEQSFTSSSSTARRVYLSVGEYEIQDSDWKPLLNTLLTLHAKRLEHLIARCESWAATTGRTALEKMVVRSKRRFKAMLAYDSNGSRALQPSGVRLHMETD